MRHVLAIPFKLLAAVLFLAGCAYNPLINREQLILVSDSQVASLAQESWREIETSRALATSTAMQARAERVANRILRANGEAPSAWTVRVFEDDTLNAFALPGGKIGIHSAMIHFCESDDELAAIIGHEIAHVKLRHAAERLSQDLAMRGAAEVAFPDQSRVRSIFGLGATLGVILPYSRRHEFEADRLGLRYQSKAGYAPDAAITLWSRMAAQKSGAGTPDWLSTHPTSQARIDALRSEVALIKEEQKT